MSVPTPDFPTAFEPLHTAAMRGQYEMLLAAAERAFEHLFADVSARVLVRTGGAWHEVPSLEHGPEEARLALPAELSQQEQGSEIRHFDGAAFVPIVAGAVAVWVRGQVQLVRPDARLHVLRQFLSMAVQMCERQRLAAQNLDEVQVLQRVATRILKSHDLGEILLLITQEAKRLLSADICGVLLLEGDSLVMKRCAGNRSPQTAELRMRPGQGLAGLVLAGREPASVEDYLHSETISRDFFHLAKAEMVRSALAAPLTGHAAVIGVLEVWRRRPSVFTSMDTMRLVALANLTSIAIENAELLSQQRRVNEELARANTALSERYDMERSVSSLSHDLMQLLLEGNGLPALVRAVSDFLGEQVAVAPDDGIVVTSRGGGTIDDELAATLSRLSQTCGTSSTPALAASPWRAQPVLVEGERVAWAVAKVGGRGDSLTDLALVQLGALAALHRLEQRAASRARAETLDALVWDLLRADEASRSAAIDRAGELKLDLAGNLRVILLELGPPAPGTAERSSTAIRQLITGEIASLQRLVVRCVAMRGSMFALLAEDLSLDDTERKVQRLTMRLAEALGGRTVVAGASSNCTSARLLAVAHDEAVIALDVARQMGRSGAVVYDRAGVVGMLLSLRHDVGLRRFLELNLGKLLAEDSKQRETLLQTLRVFFDSNCSHELASHHLGVHRKTVAHRLARISELTGLDLSTHDDRLVADLSLYVYQLMLSRPSAD